MGPGLGLGLGMGIGSGGGTSTVAPPDAPTGVTGTPNSSTQITVNWTNPSGTLMTFDGRYRIGAGSWTEVDGISKPWVVTGLAPSTTYGFEVRANGAGGAGAWSTEATATTNSPPGLQSATTTTDGLGIILTFNAAVTTNDGTLTVKKNGSTWATRDDIGSQSGDGTPTITINFVGLSPLNHQDAVTVSFNGDMWVYDPSGLPVPAVTNFAVTNNILGLQSATTTTAGDGVILTFDANVIPFLPGYTVKKNGTTWATGDGNTGTSGDGTPVITVMFSSTSPPLAHGDVVTITLEEDNSFFYDPDGPFVPPVTNFPVTNIVP